ncbi:MAG: hypothetical protein QOE87_944 [Gaiellales bacterium]|jgi:hypothetical protein|nr:hypothetical protein [Gaiellales bacterium]
MIRLRPAAAVAAAVLVTGMCGLSASPAVAADVATTACDPALAPGLAWSAPSFLAWGREGRVGANIQDAGNGPAYADGSVALALDTGSATASPSPIDSDLEYVVKAPARGTAIAANATWALVDATQTVRCGQAVALNVPLGSGKTLRYATKLQSNGVTWSAIDAGDCHDIALQPVSVTVQQGGVTRRLTAPDQCKPSGAKRVSTPDWELVLKDGAFALRALPTHSSLKARLRFALRVGSRRVASGSLSLLRTYRPVRLIVVADAEFQSVCVHGIYPVLWYGATVGCKVPGALSVRLKPA